jgi:hypothetical protein
MEYSLNLDDVRFETLFGSETFEELTGIGESIRGAKRSSGAAKAPSRLATS